MTQTTFSTHDTAERELDVTPQQRFSGLLAGFAPGQVISWGLLEALSLFPVDAGADRSGDEPPSRFVTPLEHLKLVKVPTYGTVVLRNTATQGLLIAPMHIGFFQEDAQNHATSRTLLIEAGELLEANDCFCIQQTQGGLLQEAQQRFLLLPLGLRRAAFEQRRTTGYSRLWSEIETFTRRYGVTRGGHLERFLRPNFKRLLPLRHAFEAEPGQVGAAYFIGGRLAGLEVAPTPSYWQDLFPILTMYCYGPAALMAERKRWATERQVVDLEGLTGLDDLERRLGEARASERASRIATVEALVSADWSQDVDEERAGLRVVSAVREEWRGQVVRSDTETVYESLFCDVTA
jgi:ARG and Rhodanese-Phosphatase-superfamily-associated Protein domain